MSRIAQHKWSLFSVVVTLTTFIATLAVVEILYQRGTWDPNSRLGTMLGIAGAIGFLISLVTAIAAMVRERSSGYGILALCLSILSFFLYVR